MYFMGSEKVFYLGKKYDQKKKVLLEDRLTYDPPDLTTHAIVTGMTGSGKTGLCVGLLEEAALQGIPALILDPKGDLTNLVLSFPELSAPDFEPWIDKNSAKREKKSISDIASKTAASWKKGLSDWGLGSEEIQILKNSVERTIFTPGSTTGIPVNILASFSAPDLNWDQEEEILREKISSTVTALLTLVGEKNIDPLRSREHILLANIIEHHWQQNNSLDLVKIIKEVQSPPFDQLGAFDLDDFFPKKDRMDLAISLNNVLASPSFQSWIEGPPLDIGSMLYTGDGKPRHSIFYLAHLDDAERMFFITLIYAAIETWMRKQRGTGDLRAVVYFDEIHGYLPPVANPPSKPLIIRLLKTARAYGVGLVLTTQNPVDVDYKALSNAGTWMVGRLQTDQDKQRLLDGLESAAGGIKRSEYDRLISGLGKRVFLYHNVHEKKPEIFHTRWVMSYLAGPLTLSQIPSLNSLAGATDIQENIIEKDNKEPEKIRNSSKETKPSSRDIPDTIDQFFHIEKSGEKNDSLSPSIIALAEVRYLRQRPPLDFKKTILSVIDDPEESGQDWESGQSLPFDENEILDAIKEKVQFRASPDFMENSSWWKSQESDFEHWIYETDTVTIRSSKLLDITAGPEIDEQEFSKKCKKISEEKTKQDIADLEKKFKSKIKSLQDKIERQELKVDKYKDQLSSRRTDTALKVGESLFKLVTKGKVSGVSSSSTKIRMSSEAKARLKEAETILENYEEDITTLKDEFEQMKTEIENKWNDALDDIKEIRITPTKKNIRILRFGVLWKN